MLSRNTRLVRRTPIRRTTALRQRSRTNRKPAAHSSYMNWVRSLPCIICAGAHGKSEAAHTKVFGSAGMSQKTSNRTVIPLCSWDHTQGPDSYHRMTPERTWAEYHGLDLSSYVVFLNLTFDRRREGKR